MADKKCASDCREDLIGKITVVDESKPDKKDIKGWIKWVVSIIGAIIVFVWSVGFAINNRGVDRQEAKIEKNTANITKTREEMISMSVNIILIKESQDLMLQAFGIKKGKDK